MNGPVKTQEPSGCVQSVIVPTGTEKRKFIIYKATNRANGKIYIGQTVELLKYRKAAHIRKALEGSRYYFHNAIRKYGPDVFVWEAICLCLSKDEADKKEGKFIKSFNAKGPLGYNMTDGGEGTLGCHPSEETRIKMSMATKLVIQRKGAPYFLGMKHTAESRAKITAAQTGKKRGPYSNEHNEKIRNALRGRTISEEQKAQISKTLTGYKHSDETKAKMSKSRTGTKRSAETCANIRRGWALRRQRELLAKAA